MFSRFRITKRASWLWPVLLVALVAGTLAIAACGGEDPTATPEPTATPAPTATPVPTATPEPTAMPVPTEAPESSMMSLTDIDETTTVGDLIGALSEGEAACFRTAFGEAILDAMKDQPLAVVASGFDAFPLDCLEPENAIGATVAMMSLQAGGFSDDSIACIVDVYGEHGIPGQSMDMVDAMRSFLFAQLCLTDEEALALQGGVSADDAFPPPSQLRCVAEQTDLENYIKVLEAFAMLETATELPTPDPELMMLMPELMAAQEACGIQTMFEGEGSLP